MLRDKVTVVEGDNILIGTRMIGGPSILIGFRVFELAKLGKSAAIRGLEFKTAGETYAKLKEELGEPNSLLDTVYRERMEPHKHIMLYKWYPAERVTFVDNVQSLEDILTQLVNEVQ